MKKVSPVVWYPTRVGAYHKMKKRSIIIILLMKRSIRWKQVSIAPIQS